MLAIVIVLNIQNIYASSFSARANTNTITVGGTFSITISGANLAGRFDFSSSDNVSLSATSAWIEGNDYVLTCTGNLAGAATVTINATNVASSTDATAVTGSQTVSVNIKEKVIENTQQPAVNTPPVQNAPTNNTTSSNKNTKTSANTYLSKLVMGYEGLTPNFNKEVTNYSITVPTSVTSLNMTVATEDVKSKYWISGDENLQIGNNKVTVTVTATDGSQRVYSINVVRAENEEKANAYLESIVTDYGTFSPEFVSEQLEYDLGVISKDITKLQVLAFPKDPNAKVEVKGNDDLQYGENTITILVTAPDGTTQNNYILKLVREGSDTTIQDDNLDEEFNSYQNIDDLPEYEMSFIERAKIALKNNLLDVLLLSLVLTLFAQVLYYYIKNRKLKVAYNADNDIEVDDKQGEDIYSKFSVDTNEIENQDAEMKDDYNADNKFESLESTEIKPPRRRLRRDGFNEDIFDKKDDEWKD